MDGPNDHDELLTPREVAKIFRVNSKTVSRWAKSGRLRSIRTLGGHRRFHRSEVERAMSEMENETGDTY